MGVGRPRHAETASKLDGYYLYNIIELLKARYEFTDKYLKTQGILSNPRSDQFTLDFYNFLADDIQTYLRDCQRHNIKRRGKKMLLNQLGDAESRQIELTHSVGHAQISSLEKSIAIDPVVTRRLSTRHRKMNLMNRMQAAADCTDNNTLIWIYRRLQQPDYDFLREREQQEPGNNRLFHFFRRHHTHSETWSTTIDMLKTRMMLNTLFALSEGKTASFEQIKNNKFASSLLSVHRNRWVLDSGSAKANEWINKISDCAATKAHEWINKINDSYGNQRECHVNEAIHYYQNKFRQLWPGKAVPAPAPTNSQALALASFPGSMRR